MFRAHFTQYGHHSIKQNNKFLFSFFDTLYLKSRRNFSFTLYVIAIGSVRPVREQLNSQEINSAALQVEVAASDSCFLMNNAGEEEKFKCFLSAEAQFSTVETLFEWHLCHAAACFEAWAQQHREEIVLLCLRDSYSTHTRTLIPQRCAYLLCVRTRVFVFDITSRFACGGSKIRPAWFSLAQPAVKQMTSWWRERLKKTLINGNAV